MLATYKSYGVCRAGLGAACWQPTGLMGSVGLLHVLCGLLSRVWGCMLDRVWGCMLATYRSYGVCWTGLGAVCWQPTVLMVSVGLGLGLYVGNLQVLWGLLDWAWGCMLATYRSYGVCWTVCWQPTSLMGSVGLGLGLYVGNLHVLWGLLDWAWGCMLATYRSYGVCWTGLGAVCWQPTGLMGSVGLGLGLYVGNIQVLWGLLDWAWGCMLATYWSYGVCWTGLGAVCWQPSGLMGSVGLGLGLYVGNLQVLWGLLDWAWGCMLATYRSYGVCWTGLGAVCWQPTGLMGSVGLGLGLYVGNLQVLWGLLDRVWGCMLATYRSYGVCWTGLGAVCWQPTCLMGSVGLGLGLYVGNLQVLWGLLGWAGGCMLATYRSYGVCWTGLGAVCWQPTRLMGSVGPGLGLYVGNLQVLWGLLDWAWGCMLATYRSYGVCWTGLGAVCWQPTCLMGSVGLGLGLYVGNLQVLWGLLDRVWGCMLATYRSYGVCWAGLGAVCWQPTGLMGSVGPGLGLYVGNLQVLWGLLDGAWGCMLATYTSYGVCWTGLGAVCWQPTGLMGSVEPGLGLYVGNLQVLWGLSDRVWGCMLATCKSYALCWAGFGAVCWQPTGLMRSVGPGLGLYVDNLQVLCALLGWVWGCMLTTYRSYALCWTGFGAVCRQPTGLMRSVGPGLGLYVDNLQVLCALLDRVWGCMLTTCKSYALCWAGFGAVC